MKKINVVLSGIVFLLVGMHVLAQFLSPASNTSQTNPTFYIYSLIAFISSLFILKNTFPNQKVKLTLDDVKLFSTAVSIFLIFFTCYFAYIEFLQRQPGETLSTWLITFFAKPWASLFIGSTAILQVATLLEHKSTTMLVAFSILSVALLLADGSDTIRESSSNYVRAVPYVIYVAMFVIVSFSERAKR